MLIDRARIAALIPHAGAMCLLDEVERWDADTIRCIAPQPSRRRRTLCATMGRCSALCGIEYAAQAMAVHGGLAAGTGEQAAHAAISSACATSTAAADRIDDLRAISSSTPSDR